MVITVGPELERALLEAAHREGTSPEALALEALRKRFPPKDPRLEPRDEWERRLLAIGTDCGVSLSNEALSREEMYD